MIIIFSIFLSLTLIVAIGSAVFSIRRVDAYCYNVDDPEQLDRIVNGKYDGKKSVKDLLVGKSIFALDESELISEVEAREAGIKVINIERLFPSRVSINYIKLHEYFELEQGGKYYIFGKDGKITDTLFEYDPGYIRIIMEISEPEDGINSERLSYLVEIIDIIERMGYEGSKASGIIEFIDFDIKPDYIYIKMRSGVFIEVHGYNELEEKVHSAFSIYDSDASLRLKGTIIVGDGESDTYSPYNRYEEVK